MLSGTHRNSRQEMVVYGRPALEAVLEAAKAFGASRLMVTTTASLAGPDGLGTRLARDLGDLCVGTFADIGAHSPREGVIAGADQARRLGADLLVAIGGGSVIDATKVMQLALWGDVHAAKDLDAWRAGADLAAVDIGVRMIAVPTTLSAAEFTPFGGVTDVSRHAKEGYAHPALAPRAVILDPAMTVSTPPTLWFSTGIKAVDHAVEQLCNPVRSPFSDALAAEGLRGLARGLPASRTRPGDLDVRLDCQIGMWLAMAGASSGRGLGASHAIGHILGGGFGAPHGLTSCVALPAVLRWNAGVSADRQAVVSECLGRPGVPAADAVADLIHSLGLPTDLASLGIRLDQFAAIGEQTMHDRGVRSNPRPINGPADIVAILELARA